MSEINKKNLRKVLKYVFFLVAGAIILYWLLHETERVKAVSAAIMSIVSPFILGAAIAFIINVPMRALEQRLTFISSDNLRRLIALVLAMIMVLLVLAFVFVLLIPQLAETVESMIPKLYQFVLRTEERINLFLNENPELMDWVTTNTDFENFDWGSLVEKAVTMIGNSISAILTSTFSAIGSIVRAVFNLIIAIVFAFYCLYQKETLARQGRKLLYAFLPEYVSDYVVRIMRLSNSTFSNFLSGQCLEVCILGAMFAVSMAIFRMPYILLVSVLVAVTAFIPLVGAWIGCIMGAFLILVENPLLAVWFVVMFLIIQQIEGNMIYPRVVGNSIGLSGMWVLVAITIGGSLFGIAGMFLMVPFSSVIYTLLREIANKRLACRPVPAEKLMNQPPELRSRFKEKRQQTKEKIAQRKSEKENLKKQK